jgi:2-methylcitrate dehydratase
MCAKCAIVCANIARTASRGYGAVICLRISRISAFSRTKGLAPSEEGGIVTVEESGLASFDATTRAVAERAAGLTSESIPAPVLDAARLRVADALGCICGGWHAPPALVAQRLAGRETGIAPARVLGTGQPTTVEAAAFANGIAARYLDYNDTYMGVSAGHPTDMVPALLALAEAEHRSGRELLESVVVAYEGFGVIAKQLSVRSRGWDQGILVELGVALGAARLLRLDSTATAHAVSLAVTMGVPPRSTRAGELSMWKGAATSFSARSGLLAARLAAEGMTGPPLPFEGKDGLWAQATGEFGVGPFGDPDPWLVASSAIKFYPAEFNAQAPIELVLELRGTVAVDDVASIDIWTYWSSYDEIGNEPEKWAPETRETADHSLPYLVAVALLEGDVTVDSFDEPHLRDPAIRALMAKVAVHHDPEITAQWPAKLGNRLRLTTGDGAEHVVASDFSRGHPARAPQPSDIEHKFRVLAAAALGEAGTDRAWQAIESLGGCADVASLVDCFVTTEEEGTHG